MYEDSSFTGAKALGKLSGYQESELDSTFEWVRTSQVVSESSPSSSVKEDVPPMRLFQGKIEPADVCQGAVGDCWLIAAFACLAEFPGAIQKVFVTREQNSRGKYIIRLYDAIAEQWVRVTVDDTVPRKKGESGAFFVQPNGNELWVVLLEKAFAKFCGSYQALDGGQVVWAWQALTGDNVLELHLNQQGEWVRKDVVYPKERDERNRRAIRYRVSDEKFDDETVFKMLKQYNAQRSVMAGAITSGAGEVKHENVGLVAGHAYSIIEVVEVSSIKLLQLRNPWGSFEWKGDWSDNSTKWQEHPDIKTSLAFEPKDDGTFWMSYTDFCKHYNRVYICDRTADDDLRLDIREDEGCLGPTKGCVTDDAFCAKGRLQHCFDVTL
eukprot:gene5783-6975_t